MCGFRKGLCGVHTRTHSHLEEVRPRKKTEVRDFSDEVLSLTRRGRDLLWIQGSYICSFVFD